LPERFRFRALLLTGFLLLASGLTFDPKLYVSGDNVEYSLLAQKLLGEGVLWGSRKFPPFFPMLLAPVQLLFGTAWVPQKIFVFLLYLASGPLMLRLGERLLPRSWALATVAVAMISVPVLEFSHYVMSEIPFLFLSLAALVVGGEMLWLPHRGSEIPPAAPGNRTGSGAGRLLIYFLLAGLAFYTRSTGAALIVAFLLIALFARRPKLLLAGLGLTAAVLIPWVVHTYFSGLTGHTYLDQLLYINPYYPRMGMLDAKWLLIRLQQNADYYFLLEIPWVIFPFGYRSTYSLHVGPEATALPVVLGLIVNGLILFGFVRALRRFPLLAAYVGVSLATAVGWPQIWASVRFILPLLPLLCLFFVVGMWHLKRVVEQAWQARRWRDRRAAAASVWVPTIILTLVLAGMFGLGVRNLFHYHAETRQYPCPWELYFRAAEWSGANLPPGSLVLDRKPGMFGLVSGLPATSFPREKDPEKMLDFLRVKGVRYVHASVIPYDDMREFLYPFLARRDSYFDITWTSSHPAGTSVALLEFYPDGGRQGFDVSWTEPP
jgi:4-amino-4-deoxy-L-arabinose transferase-like glycosyltransferase